MTYINQPAVFDHLQRSCINIEAHQDGWLTYYPLEACGSGWTTGDDTPIRCKGYYADLLTVKDFATSFVNFHDLFSAFVNNRINHDT